MSQSKPFRPTSGPHLSTPGKPTGAPPQPAAAVGKPASTPPAGESRGKVVHDDRGNAVWDWLKETSRIAIESTTRLLKKLETPDLKMEDTQDKELRIMPDQGKCAGGGYDPYNQPTKQRKPGGK